MRRILSIIATLLWLAGNAGTAQAGPPTGVSLLSAVEAGLEMSYGQKADVSVVGTADHALSRTEKHSRPAHDTSNHTHDAGTEVILALNYANTAKLLWSCSLTACLAEALRGTWERPPRTFLY